MLTFIVNSSLTLAFAFAFTLAVPAAARAADKEAPAAKSAAKAEKTNGKEVTLKGDLGCGKCNFKTTKECQNVLKVNDGGKDTMYYLAANSVSKENHEAVCSGTKPATVTGTVGEEGKGASKKKVLTASAIKID
jgi:ABC-type enterochelin transport system substrate-binding protein